MFFAFSSSPAINKVSFSLPNFPLLMFSAKIVLKALTTFAFGNILAISSAEEELNPMAHLKSGVNEFVTSITTFSKLLSPFASISDFISLNGTANIITSPCSAASLIVVILAFLGISFFLDSGFLEP